MAPERVNAVTVGLEIHVRLLTATKLFCGCANRFGAPPNTLTCPVCRGLPGALPVLQPGATELACRVGLALGCDLAPQSAFDRKNYFYPDLPRNYQITQYDRPLGRGGALTAAGRTVRLGRIHLEEDAGRLAPLPGGGIGLDLNRAGTPLVEIVTAPDLPDGATAAAWLRRLRQVLLYIGASDGRMAEGSLRCDANVGLPGGAALVELKNLNSFRALERAIDQEAARLAVAAASGAPPRPSTRGWDEAAGRTRHQRWKEATADYRYHREPDLPPLALPAALVRRLAAELPTLPDARERELASVGLDPATAALICRLPERADWFAALLAALPDPAADARAAAAWFTGDVLAAATAGPDGNEVYPLEPAWLAGLLELLAGGRVTGPTAKRLLAGRVAGDRRPAAAVLEAAGLEVIDAPEQLAGLCREVLAAHPEQAAAWRAGRREVLEFLIGRVMAATSGRADPRRLREVFAALEEARD